jgi:hypothetical protein
MNLRFKAPLFFTLFGLFCLLLPNTARADSFDWTYQGTTAIYGPLNSGSGVITTSDGVITGISGVFDGSAITALLPLEAFLGNDNVLLVPPTPLYLTLNGFSFQDAAGNLVNVYGSIGTQCEGGGSVCVPYDVYLAAIDNGFLDIGDFTVTPIAVTPEPGTITLLLVAALSLGLFFPLNRIRARVCTQIQPLSCEVPVP